MYACEAWGETSYNLTNASPTLKDPYEKIHIKACKQILGVHRKTMNIPVLAELGRFPLKLSIDIQMVKYFMRFKNITKKNYLYEIYQESLKQDELKDNYFAYIKMLLEQTGLSYIWRTRETQSDSINLVKTISQRMKDIYSQSAIMYINKDENVDRGKMQFLRGMKDTYSFEPYLNIQNDQHRKSISRLRLSSHRLAIETGRWQKIPKENRLCRYCNLNKIESESHFLFECHSYVPGRNSLFIC